MANCSPRASDRTAPGPALSPFLIKTAQGCFLIKTAQGCCERNEQMLELIKRITHVDASEIHDNLVLPYELRIRGRLRATTETNLDVGLFLDRGPVLRDGDLRSEERRVGKEWRSGGAR